MFNIGIQNKWEPDLEISLDKNSKETTKDNVEEKEENDKKFSFDSNARSQPASNILGIPTNKEPPIPLPK
jgi:hypothetical protein